MDLQYLSILLILIVVLILQIYITFTINNIKSFNKLEKFGNGCRPGQLKNFGICMNPQN